MAAGTSNLFVALSTPVCVCVFKVMQLMKNRGLVSFCILTLSDDFFFQLFSRFVFLVNYRRMPEGRAHSMFYREIEYITQSNNFIYICIFLSDSINHHPALWVVLNPKVRTAASNFAAL